MVEQNDNDLIGQSKPHEQSGFEPDSSNWRVMMSNYPHRGSETFKIFSQVLGAYGEQVALRSEVDERGLEILRLCASPETANEVNMITSILWRTPQYYDLRSKQLEKNARIDNREQQAILSNAYESIMQQVGGREYFTVTGQETESPRLFDFRELGTAHPIKILADELKSRGYDIKEFNFGYATMFLAKGDALKAFSKAKNTPEIEALGIHYWKPIWMNYGINNDKEYLDQLVQQARLTDEEINAVKAAEVMDGINKISNPESRWYGSEEERKSFLEKASVEFQEFGILDPQDILRDTISEVIERELSETSDKDSESDFNHVPYSKTDFETGFMHVRMRKIVEQIIDMYGLDEQIADNEPYLEFVDYDQYRERNWMVSVDGMLAPVTRAPGSSYFSLKGEGYFNQPEDRSVISVLFENTGDETLIEEVLHWLHFEEIDLDEDRPDPTKSAFFQAVNSEALAYLTTKNFIPTRYMTPPDQEVLGFSDGFTQEKLQELVVTAGVKLESAILEQNGVATFEEWFNRNHFKSLIGAFPGPVIHEIGYFLGNLAHEKMKKGEILPHQLRNIFFRKGDPIEQYKQMVTLILS